MKHIFILAILFLTSCNSENLNLSLFDKSQKEILKKIIMLNDSLLNQYNNFPINESYYNQLKKLNNSQSASEILNNEFIKDDSFCISLQKSNIIILKKAKKYNPKGEGFVYSLNLDSNYLSFIKHLSNKNNTILEYYNSIISTGTLSPISTKIITHYLTKEDLKNDNIRLVISVHFLLINNSEFQNEIIN
jgi:hypothetical protein